MRDMGADSSARICSGMLSMPKTTLFMEWGEFPGFEIHGISQPRRSRKAVQSEKKAYQGFCFPQEPEQLFFREAVTFSAVIPAIPERKRPFLEAGDIFLVEKINDSLSRRRRRFPVSVRFQQTVHVERALQR